MSQKRTLADSNATGASDEDSEQLLQDTDIGDNNVKRAKLEVWSDTALQDLPIELLEDILIKAVTAEVKDMKLAKSVWKEKADLVIRRLGVVCSLWNDVIESEFFRIELHRNLDGTAPEYIRLQFLKRSPFLKRTLKAVCLRDHLYTHAMEDTVSIYDIHHLNKAAGTVLLSSEIIVDLAACPVANCVYVLSFGSERISRSVHRMVKISNESLEPEQFKVNVFLQDLNMRIGNLATTARGQLLVMCGQELSSPASVTLYNLDGCIERTFSLADDIYSYSSSATVVERPNGNFVFVSSNHCFVRQLSELDAMGHIIRQYQSSLSANSLVQCGDDLGRIIIVDSSRKMELLDSDLNRMNVNREGVNDDQLLRARSLCFDKQRNQLLAICSNAGNSIVSFFKLSG